MKIWKIVKCTLIMMVFTLVLSANAMTANASEIVRESGTWGTLNWKVTTEAIVISGSGEMPAAENQSYPWRIQYGDDNVTKIIIEEGVTSIAPQAFYCDYGIQSVSISSTVKSIGEKAFMNCEDLKTVTIASGSQLEVLGKEAFESCELIESFVIPNSVTTIEYGCFQYCKGLNSITLGNKISVIGPSAFSNCVNLSSVTFPNSLQTIGESAFSYCTGLETVTFPTSIKEIGGGAFYRCSGLSGKIVIPKSVETVGGVVFGDCIGIDTVEYYATAAVPYRMFGGCTGLKKVILGSEVSGIGGLNPFYGCSVDTVINYGMNTKFYEVYNHIENPFADGTSENFVIYGYFGSTMEGIAERFGYDFIAFAPTISKIYNTSTGVKIEWKDAGATYYNVYRSTNQASGYTLIKSEVTNTSYIDTTVASMNTYYYKIMACKEFTSSSLSAASDGITYLAAPTFKKVVNVVSGVHVYWNAFEGAKTYSVYRSTKKDSGYELVKSGLTATHYIDTTVKSGTTYYYKIIALNGSLKSAYSKPFNAITYVETPDITSRFNKGAGVQLGWNKIEGATGYAIYRKPYNGNTWTRVTTIKGNSTFTWMDESVKTNNGTVYKYTIRALAGSDMKTLSGCRSTGRTMARLTSRTLNSATKASATSIKCNWTTTTVCNGYEVRFMVGDKVYNTYTVGNYKTGVKTFTGLKTGQTYKIQVRSYKKVDGVGTFYSAWSTAKSVSL